LKDSNYTNYSCKKFRQKLETIQHTIGASCSSSRRFYSSQQAKIVYQELAITFGQSNSAQMPLINTNRNPCYRTPATIQWQLHSNLWNYL